MKLVINIPEFIYELSKKIVKNPFKGNQITKSLAKGIVIPTLRHSPRKYITNGDMIKAVFVDAEYFTREENDCLYVYVNIKGTETTWKVKKEWWDEKYTDPFDTLV